MLSQEAFGNKIKELRESKGITQIQLADQMMVSRSTIQMKVLNIEKQ